MMKSSNIYSVRYSVDERNIGNSNFIDLKELKESNCDLKDSLTNDTWKRIDKEKC
jgi:hypothetical protein